MTSETKPPKKVDVQKLQRAIVDGLEDVKGQEIVVFNTEHLSALFERVIIASGTSNRQTKALASSVVDAVREAGFPKPRVEGQENGEWIIVDCGAAVAHVMQPTIRSYYHLEEIWGGKTVHLKHGAEVKKPEAAAPAAKGKTAAAKTTVATTGKAVSAKPAATKVAAGKTPAAKAAPAKTAKPAAKKAVAVAEAPAAKAPARKRPSASTAISQPAVAKKAAAPAKKVVVAKSSSKLVGKVTDQAPKAPARKAAPVKTMVVGKPAAKKAAPTSGPGAKRPAARKTPGRKTAG